MSSSVKNELPGRAKELKTEAKVYGEQIGQKIDHAVSLLYSSPRWPPPANTFSRSRTPVTRPASSTPSSSHTAPTQRRTSTSTARMPRRSSTVPSTPLTRRSVMPLPTQRPPSRSRPSRQRAACPAGSAASKFLPVVHATQHESRMA
jgi:hypothetical protein